MTPGEVCIPSLNHYLEGQLDHLPPTPTPPARIEAVQLLLDRHKVNLPRWGGYEAPVLEVVTIYKSQFRDPPFPLVSMSSSAFTRGSAP